MKEYIGQLLKCVLFRNMDQDEIIRAFNKIPYQIIEHNKGELIAIEGDDCHSLGIILRGKIEIQKVFPSGQVMTINIFSEGNIFGESLIFSNKHTYPATITAIEKAKIMYIKKENIIELSMFEPKVLTNFVSVLSERILMLNNRIANLSQDTIRKKIANYLLHEYNIQKTTVLNIPFTRKRMAELLNIPRPSLSRELGHMKEEGIIDLDKNIIKILNIQLLEEALFN
ncbi:Crp/Fnr family transcriptional regulator [Tepidimicrobium xylanilyticum]|uniref:cAMP-binding domain of CRP or a regulatory subunit of cAMP-dependent protein kinases n=1 Tax=Tepidimicrobium xylanilyticum TaxID=1123352 RepID=A0A1H2VGY7_9FIRM|nr:Crp/Fnr family transcriptional regulator [Tepidimicrobium xylanilyticum]GMG96640.1 cAMP-binding protein [Tepidimicrobium xylanilyticum]SDW67572.1 cAMP-binding domain of CRP or a regulatory subunit of cAMP-dependent protein kinases [Tepidimicrobium xylanilyticum]